MPAVVLLLMMVARGHWDATAQKLAERIAGARHDFRRNGGPRLGRWRRAATTDPSSMGCGPAYLVAARSRAGRTACWVRHGASVAVLSAASDPQVRSLALLSPSLEYRGLRTEQPLRKYGSRPALLVVSSEDPYALRSARAMVSMGDGARELRVLSGAGHGTVMLSREPDLSSALVDWFLRTLL